jgi:hypothetical protein
MSAIDSIHLYPQVNEYWKLVKKSLDMIFNADSAQADTLRKEVTTWPPPEQLLFYHAEPLYIAADLAGQQPTDPQVEKYINIAADSGWYVNWLPPLPSP